VSRSLTVLGLDFVSFSTASAGTAMLEIGLFLQLQRWQRVPILFFGDSLALVENEILRKAAVLFQLQNAS
jgi:hypothetical protein